MRIQRNRRFKHFIMLASVSFVSLLAGSMTLFCFLFAPQERFFFNVAGALVISWTTILTLYYIWAIYFYNINRGWTDKEWKEHYRTAAAKTEPVRNPNSEETLGLPPGTVRGTLALSVLVAGMAMLIASLGMPLSVRESELMIDHFEFFKTGFVMVIAFYFGTKSLEILRDRKGVAGKTAHSPTADDATTVSDATQKAGYQFPVAGEENLLTQSEV